MRVKRAAVVHDVYDKFGASLLVTHYLGCNILGCAVYVTKTADRCGRSRDSSTAPWKSAKIYRDNIVPEDGPVVSGEKTCLMQNVRLALKDILRQHICSF